MKNKTTLASGNQLWAIYYADREYAREMDHPIRTVVEAPTKIAAEEFAARLGFSDACADPVMPEQAKQAQWLPERPRNHQLRFGGNHSHGVHI